MALIGALVDQETLDRLNALTERRQDQAEGLAVVFREPVVDAGAGLDEE